MVVLPKASANHVVVAVIAVVVVVVVVVVAVVVVCSSLFLFMRRDRQSRVITKKSACPVSGRKIRIRKTRVQASQI